MNTPAQWGELLELLREDMLAELGRPAVQDLKASGHEATAGRLGDLLAVVDATRGGNALDRPGAEEAATALVDACWKRLESGVGWDLPAWRECYVMSQLCLVVVAGLASLEDRASTHTLLASAMERVDLCIIMGMPVPYAEPFTAVLEPVVSQKRCKLPAYCRVQRDAPPPSLTPVVQPGCDVPCLHNPPVQLFQDEFFKHNRPVVFKGLASKWKAVKQWKNLQWFVDRYGHRTVPLEMGSHTDPNWYEKTMTIREFVSEYVAPLHARNLGLEPSVIDNNDIPRDPAPPLAYLAQHHLPEHIPELGRDIEVPQYCKVGQYEKTNVWFGPAGTITPCHFDSYDNLYVQVVGFKYIRLYSEDQTPFLYRCANSWKKQRKWPNAAPLGDSDKPAKVDDNAPPMGTISLVDVEAPDLERFPEFAKAKCMEVVMAPGDVLYIPPRCWHYIRALTTSISLNFLF